MPVDLVQYEHGRLLYLSNDIHLSRFLGEHHQYSPGEVRLFREIVRPQDIVIEAGANIGMHTIPLARMAAQVYAFEPQPRLYYLLCGNLGLNAIDNATAFNAAVGDGCGVITVPTLDYDKPNNFGGVGLSKENGYAGFSWGIEVPLVALDSLDRQFPALRLLKIDCEGMECEVLKGAAKLIARTRPYLYLEDDRRERSRELHALLDAWGYRAYPHRPLYVEGVAGEELVSLNVLAVPLEAEGEIPEG